MNKLVVVTGANRGIGFQICKNLAEDHGFKVILCSRNKENGTQAASNINGDVEVAELDVANNDSIKAFIENFPYDHLDVLINNAAILINASSIGSVPISDIEDTMNINYYGPLKLTRGLVPLLQKGTSPKVINISSGMGAIHDLDNGHAAYRTSKLALNGQTIMMAKELQPYDISVNAICPGWVQTEMGGNGAPRSVEKGAETPVWMASGNDIPTGKFWRDKSVIDW